MTIDWSAFSPGSALLGGAVIGLAAAVFILACGQVAGISGMGWRIAFISGLVVAPLMYSVVATLPAIQVDAGYVTLVIAGLLVGFGTRLGGGCTSGHGVCGLSRFSMRSLLATGCFMTAGVATVWVTRHLFQL
jgi:uncharacterized protein